MRYEYEGHIAFQDVEPGVGGDVILLLDHPQEYATLDADLQQWLGGSLSCAGPLPARYRISVEEIA